MFATYFSKRTEEEIEDNWSKDTSLGYTLSKCSFGGFGTNSITICDNHSLISSSKVIFKPFEAGVSDTKMVLETSKNETMLQTIKGCAEIKHYETHDFLFVNGF